jgi:hypothetical protein
LAQSNPWGFESLVEQPTESAAQACLAQSEPSEWRAQSLPALRRVPRRILVTGLKIVRAQHHDHGGERRIHFDALSQTVQTHPARLEWILPYGAPPIQTVFDHANWPAASNELRLKHSWPPLRERQTLPCVWDDAPTQRIAVDQNLMHVFGHLLRVAFILGLEIQHSAST